MSALLRVDGKPADSFLPVGEEDPIPSTGAIVLSLARWEAEHVALGERKEALGVRLSNTAEVEKLDAALLDVDMILLDFPSFADGRGYSQARLLRDLRGYKGELRATGSAVVRDQLLGMVRCGIDSFDLRGDQSVQLCERALSEFSIAYQPARDRKPTVRDLRRGTTTN